MPILNHFDVFVFDILEELLNLNAAIFPTLQVIISGRTKEKRSCSFFESFPFYSCIIIWSFLLNTEGFNYFITSCKAHDSFIVVNALLLVFCTLDIEVVLGFHFINDLYLWMRSGWGFIIGSRSGIILEDPIFLLGLKIGEWGRGFLWVFYFTEVIWRKNKLKMVRVFCVNKWVVLH